MSPHPTSYEESMSQHGVASGSLGLIEPLLLCSTRQSHQDKPPWMHFTAEFLCPPLPLSSYPLSPARLLFQSAALHGRMQPLSIGKPAGIFLHWVDSHVSFLFSLSKLFWKARSQFQCDGVRGRHTWVLSHCSGHWGLEDGHHTSHHTSTISHFT